MTFHGAQPWFMIKKFIVLAVFLLVFIPNKMHQQADEPIKQQVPKTPEELVTYYATKYGVSQDLAHYIAVNESHYKPNEVGDENITCRAQNSPYKGQAVYARGVYQITRCYHPQVTDAQAFDPEYNIEYAMKLIAKGRSTCISQFSTCRDYYKS